MIVVPFWGCCLSFLAKEIYFFKKVSSFFYINAYSAILYNRHLYTAL